MQCHFTEQSEMKQQQISKNFVDYVTNKII